MAEYISSNETSPLKGRLYNNSSETDLDLSKIAEHLMEKGIFEEVEVRDSFPEEYEDEIEQIATALAETQVRNLEKPERDFQTESRDIDFEKKLLLGEESGLTSVLYDGFRLSKAFSDLLPEDERSDSYLHIIFTDRFFATWKPATKRYHARVSAYGFPSVISTAGVVDAPARPWGSYKIEKEGDGLKVVDESEEFEGSYVAHGDERLTEIMKGYALQAVFYHLHLGPFCNNKKCALYNPHLQVNIVKSKLSEPDLCTKHRKVLEELRTKVSDNR
ncbi:hypothetical protein AKJ36_00285 [candidate division MSBL1 archaeon SCGC-AAA259I07]|uniref:Uncharacterized protein n=2 Tax=candidate division MSBL1 TaxID=215777 RepID=A0A133U8Z6_9EURY|nr:hypothetical protein AKJ61_00070 [candidate division MSBL1 archaeon SCGC-AAA259B11]KXA95517.1 hypothetical protein AKJ36_00285 [candidate division MSBL1 archaeon SCGC-AAA259I07]